MRSASSRYAVAMRLSPQARQAILLVVQESLGAEAEVRVFGSRLDDSALGGDVDLHVRVPRCLDNPVWEGCVLAARLQRRLDGRRVDVRLQDAATASEPIDRVALADGVRL